MDNKLTNEDFMRERGYFTANGYTFKVQPVFLGEEEEYLEEVSFSPVPSPAEGDAIIDKDNDKKMGHCVIALFSTAFNGVPHKRKSKIQEFFSFIFRRRDYRYYKDYPIIQPLIKWIEQKVTYKGKKIRFYDLERKYELSKADIERLFIYFHELSGF